MSRPPDAQPRPQPTSTPSAPSGGAGGRLRLQLWTWTAALLVVSAALAWSVFRAGPAPSPLGRGPEVRAAAGPANALADADDSAGTALEEAPQPGFDPYAPEHPSFDQAEFERQLEAARPAREPR